MLLKDSATPAHMREDLQTIGQHVEIEKRLISDLLDYAAMHSGSLRLYRQSLSLHAMVRQAAALWREQLQAQSLCLELQLDATRDQVLGDQQRLEQVLWNLMHHAVRRSPKDSSIVLRSFGPHEGSVALEVCDSGRTMDAQLIAWTFAPFEHDLRVGEGSEQNLALGLAVSKGIIEAHGGTIRLVSHAQPSATTLTVQLPLHQA
jgi:signal transduction histidine kinase